MLLICISTVAISQSRSIQSEMKPERKDKLLSKVSEKLELTEAEKASFLPILNEYMDDMHQLRLDIMGSRHGKKMKDLSDDDVHALLDKTFDHREAELALQRKYHDRFVRALPIKKVARFYHIERKMKMKHKKRGMKKHLKRRWKGKDKE